MHCEFDQLCSVICLSSIESVSNFTCGFMGEVRSLIVALNYGGIFGLVQVAVILDLCD